MTNQNPHWDNYRNWDDHPENNPAAHNPYQQDPTSSFHQPGAGLPPGFGDQSQDEATPEYGQTQEPAPRSFNEGDPSPFRPGENYDPERDGYYLPNQNAWVGGEHSTTNWSKIAIVVILSVGLIAMVLLFLGF